MTAVRNSIRVAAEADAVLAIVLDVEGYPSWQAEVDHADVLEADASGRPLRTRIWINALGRAGNYTVAYEYPAPNEVRYHLVEGDMMSRHDARFHVTPVDGEVEFTVELDLALKWPLPAMLVGVLARKGVSEMLTAVKELAERGAAA
jgi:ribosome-associated toxin RatA of RatAB toxin-antitoxin module